MMDFSAALPTFVITLREGVEATLVVGIVLAYLQKAKQTHLNRWVWSGVTVGLGASVLVGVVFSWLIPTLGAANPKYAPVVEPALEATFSLAAIVMLSWMLIWMTQQARQMKKQVEGSVNASLQGDAGAGWGIFSLICLAVLREGFESVLFIAAKFQQGVVPAIGAVAGVVSAVAIGFLLFRFGIRINLRQFFLIMGVFLLLIVAGLVVSALGDLDEAIAALAQIDPAAASLCFYHSSTAPIQSCVLGPLVWNLREILPRREFPGILLRTLFGYDDTLFLVQAIAYLLFLGTIGGAYWWNLRDRSLLSQPSDPKLRSSPE
jgi:high-affinity iron transporter